jgi:hypothetical protein
MAFFSNYSDLENAYSSTAYLDSGFQSNSKVDKELLHKILEPISVNASNVIERMKELKEKVQLLNKNIKDIDKALRDMTEKSNQLKESHQTYFTLLLNIRDELCREDTSKSVPISEIKPESSFTLLPLLEAQETRTSMHGSTDLRDLSKLKEELSKETLEKEKERVNCLVDPTFSSNYNKVSKEIENLFNKETQTIRTYLKEQKEKYELELSDTLLNLATQARFMKESIKETMTEEEKANLTNTSICSICITNPVNCVLDKCGHTYCLDCSKSLNKTCPYCRTKFEKAIKIFFN